MSGQRCPCGEVHELSAAARAACEAVTGGLPADARITTPAGTWLVPRIFIAVHGIKAGDLPRLAEQYGFEGPA